MLSKCVVDDVHLSSQTANLVKLIASSLRQKFIRIQAPSGGSETASREQSRHHSPHHPDGHVHHVVQHHSDGPDHPVVQHNQPSTPFGFRAAQSRGDPLAGIQAQRMTDFSNGSYMPPLNYDLYMQGVDPNMDPDLSSNQTLSHSNGPNNDWFALPLDNIFNSNMGIVDQGFGGIGPTVGDRDMLEVLTNERYDPWDAAGLAFPNGYQ